MLSLTASNDAQAAKIAALEAQLQKVTALEDELKAALEQLHANDRVAARR